LDSNAIKSLIGRKKPLVAECELTLFENCDIVCSFCGHEKESTTGLSREEILSKLPLVEEFLDSIDDDIETVNLHLVGGELLQDRLLDNGHGEEVSYLEYYSELILAYKEICIAKGIEPRINLVTNLLTTKQEEVRSWLVDINQEVYARIIASYDLYGRPITRQFFKNIAYFEDYIANINVVVTKQSIKKLIEGDPHFDFLYDKFPIFMDDFLPDRWTSNMIPSDEEYLEYLQCVKERYPKLLPFGESMEYVKEAKVNEVQFTTFNKCNILPNNKVTNYLWDRHNLSDFDGDTTYVDNSNLLYNFIEKNSCLTCEYYMACPLRCPVSWSWKERERSKGCVNKRFFDTI